MLPTGRGLQLEQTLQGTHMIPSAHTFFSGQKKQFFIICLFILVFVPHGSSWPYGKMEPLRSALLSMSLIYVPVFVLQNSDSALSPSLPPFCLWSAHQGFRGRQWCRSQPLSQTSLRNVVLKSAETCLVWACLLLTHNEGLMLLFTHQGYSSLFDENKIFFIFFVLMKVADVVFLPGTLACFCLNSLSLFAAWISAEKWLMFDAIMLTVVMCVRHAVSKAPNQTDSSLP